MFKNSPHCKSDTAKHSFGYDQILGLSSPPRKRYLHVNYGVFTHVAQAASKWCLLFGARWIMKPWFGCLGNSISSKIQWVFLFFWSQKRWAWLIHILSTSKADVFSRLDLLGRRSFSTFPQVAQPAQIYDSLQLGHRCGAGRKRDPRLVQRGLVSLANGILLVTSPQNNVSTHCRRRDSQRNVFFGEMGWTYSCWGFEEMVDFLINKFVKQSQSMIQYISKWLWHVVIEFWNNGGSKANHPEPFSLDAFVRIRFGKLSTLSSGDLAGWLGTELKSYRPANHADVAGVTICLDPLQFFVSLCR